MQFLESVKKAIAWTTVISRSQVLFSWLLIFFVLEAASTSFGQELKNVRVRLVNGSSIRATIDKIDNDGLVVGSRHVDGIRLDEIVNLDTGNSVSQGKPRAFAQLRMDGMIPLDSVEVANDQVITKIQEQSQSFPLEIFRAIIWNNSAKVTETASAPSAEIDSIIVKTSRGEKVVPGLLDSISDTHVVIDYKGEMKRISLDKVQAVVMANLGEEDPIGVRGSVSLVNGSKIVGVIREYGQGVLTMAISKQFEMPISVDQISRIVVQSQRVQYLSDIEPVRTEEQSQFAAARSWQRDKSLLGNPIRLKHNSTGRVMEFDKGIGTRSYTSLVYQNENEFSHFRAVVGIDMETQGHGDCEMVVEGDGIKLWSKRVTALDDPEPIVLSIEGIEEIALIVRPGENFDLADHAVWADVRFTKSD